MGQLTNNDWLNSLRFQLNEEVELRVVVLFEYGANRPDTEYLVIATKKNGRKAFICKLDPDGIPKSWYANEFDSEMITNSLSSFPRLVAISQVLER